MKKANDRPLYIGSMILSVLKYVVLIVCCLVVLVPIAVILLGSFKDSKELANTTVFTLPESFGLDNFRTALYTKDIIGSLKNTALIIIVSCVGSIITGTMTAFAVQRFSSYFTKFVKGAFLLATLLPNISMQVTVFQIVNKMGLYNTIWAPIILYVGTDIVSIYIFIQFLSQISVSLDESAIMDGASYPRIYFSIILPNLKPAIATVLIIKFVSIYNDFYTPQLYMQDKDLSVVSTALYQLMNETTIQWEVVFAGIIICIIPTLVIFLFLQKYIYSGLVSGSVKE
ncbi:carbohydrate ABC transporter permease [Ruminococcus sp. Marseille-P6503]|uniref:carbohydrate ABC transporter permease n=1 Tax=Ruminococcus sp. Marseille-P6503 TaxID=2364796 RepID=UPI000F5317EF|nr:carbohydrate ABC transporter permease [Ruminococcus sp. Marseille-P6503]